MLIYSLLSPVIEPKGMVSSCDRGGSGWTSGRGSSLRGWSHTGTGSPGMQSLHQACLNLRSIWTVHLVTRSKILGRPVWCQELDSMVLMGPFQLMIFYDFMFLCVQIFTMGMTVDPVKIYQITLKYVRSDAISRLDFHRKLEFL